MSVFEDTILRLIDNAGLAMGGTGSLVSGVGRKLGDGAQEPQFNQKANKYSPMSMDAVLESDIAARSLPVYGYGPKGTAIEGWPISLDRSLIEPLATSGTDGVPLRNPGRTEPLYASPSTYENFLLGKSSSDDNNEYARWIEELAMENAAINPNAGYTHWGPQTPTEGNSYNAGNAFVQRKKKERASRKA